VLLAAGAVTTTAAPGPPLTLVRDGRPMGVIVAPTTGATDDVQAGVELQRYLRKMSGATVPIVAAATEGQTSVRVGVFGRPPVDGWAGTRPPRDGFAIEAHGRTLFVVGGDERGALYGAYDLLETDLGVRWFMPGDLGEDVPVRRDVNLPQKPRRGQPAFEAVGGFSWAGGPGAADWEKHVRALVGPRSAFFGHNWSGIIAPTPENKADHPDWFAIHDGRRTDQLCSGNAEVVRLTVARAREFFAQQPDALVFSISPNDGDEFCEDERCRSIDRLYHVTDGSLTDRLVYFGNEVLTGLAESHPGKQVGLLAYMSYIRPPRVVRPLPNLAVMITRMPWEFCHVHALDDEGCEINRRFVEYLKGWQRVAAHVAVYDYYGHFNAFTPWPILHSIRRDLPFLHRLGVARFMSETQQHWANQGLNFYVGAKLAWDPSLDVDLLLEDYFSRFYGGAASPMRRYWRRWEDAMIATGARGHGGYQWQQMFTPELLVECDQLLREAEQRAAVDPNRKFARRVELARAGFRYTEAWTRMRTHAARAEWEAAVAAGEEAIACVQDADGERPQAFWLPLAVQQTQTMMAPYRAALPRP
jgi:Domain of unknown function (DUF4838)/Glycosyl hydrolase family 67 N-terminus